MRDLRAAGCKRAYIDGSFITTKEHPGDFDACWDLDGVDFDVIDEVRDRLRIMGGLAKIRTPGAQTGRCARRRATITACPM